MEETLKELKEVHSSSLIIILCGENIRIYDEDAAILEYNSTLISENNVLVCKFKYLDKIIGILKSNKINYVILDKDRNYKIYDYYYNDYNKYEKNLRRSRKFNKYRKLLVYFYNYIFGIPINRYK
jgi:hypothetical protein